MIGAAVAAVGLTLGGIFMFSGGDDETADSSATTEPNATATTTTTVDDMFAGELFLEAINEPIANGFSDDGFLTQSEARPDAFLSPQGVDVAFDGGGTIAGTEPGLYGGSRDSTVCDPDAMVAFLAANPDNGAAWAAVHDIDPSEIGDFVAGLTPVILTVDTAVTNHGYADGQATPHQAILQAGTAVLVDERGVPGVKCSCGNPLREPVPGTDPTGASGTPWEGFDPDRVATVAPGDPGDGFILIDTAGGSPFNRPIGGDLPDQELDTETLCTFFPDDRRCGVVEVAAIAGDGPMMNGRLGPSDFRFHSPVHISRIQTTHYNDGMGSDPGTIELVALDGTIYGPFPAQGCNVPMAAQGTCPEPGNLHWWADVDLDLEPGTYRVYPSDRDTWSQNEATEGRGMTQIWGTWPEGAPVWAADLRQLVDLGSHLAIIPDQAPRNGSSVTFDTPVLIDRIRTYHWNEGNGAPGGTIGLIGPDGTTYGPWPALACEQSWSFSDPCTSFDPPRYWFSDEDVALDAGTYQVIDSDPATWANNEETGYRGIVQIWGYLPAPDAPEALPPVDGESDGDAVAAGGEATTIDLTVQRRAIPVGPDAILSCVDRDDLFRATSSWGYRLDERSNLHYPDYFIGVAVREAYRGPGTYSGTIYFTDSARAEGGNPDDQYTNSAEADVEVVEADGTRTYTASMEADGDAATATFVCPLDSPYEGPLGGYDGEPTTIGLLIGDTAIDVLPDLSGSCGLDPLGDNYVVSASWGTRNVGGNLFVPLQTVDIFFPADANPPSGSFDVLARILDSSGFPGNGEAFNYSEHMETHQMNMRIDAYEVDGFPTFQGSLSQFGTPRIELDVHVVCMPSGQAIIGTSP